MWDLKKWHAPPPPDGALQEKYWRVGGLSKQENIELIALANVGMTLKTISEFTGLSVSQVTYRCKIFGIKVTDFRHGRGPIAQMVFERVGNAVANRSMQLVREHEAQHEREKAKAA